MSHCRTALVVFALAFAAFSPVFAAEPAAVDDPLAIELPLQTPAPKPTAPPCQACATGFTTSPGGGQASHWGHGSDCTSAQNDLRSQLLAAANAFCMDLDGLPRCSFQVVHTVACWWNGSQYVSDGYANFGCWIYIC